jgi:hypothetical protein
MDFHHPKIRKVMFDKNFEKKLNSTQLAARKTFSSHWFVAFWATKRGKLPRNFTKSATELPEVRMLDVIENPLLTLTPQLVS